MNHIPSPAPKTGDELLEYAIKRVGADKAPRVTPTDIEANIASTVYFTAFQGFKGNDGTEDQSLATCDALRLLTFCVLILRNGTKIVGISYGAIDPNQHSEQRGREEARAHAIAQIWPLMGYELRSKLSEF
mgnify:CR=1 FL=1